MKALVTGSGGLAGSACVRLLCSQSWTVIGLDNDMRGQFFGPAASTRAVIDDLRAAFPTYQHHDVDIRDRQRVRDLLQQERPHLIIHAAGQPSHELASSQPYEDFDTNAVGTLNMLVAARDFCRESPFCFTSSNKVYGDRPNDLALVELPTRYDYADGRSGIDESMSIDHCLHSVFGASKVAADVLCQEFGRYFGMPVGIFRAGCITGPDHAAVEMHGFLAYIVRCAMAGREYSIFGYKGKQVRDQIHAEDVARLFLEFFEAPRCGEVYNLGGGRQNSLSILEAVDLLGELGYPLSVRYEEANRAGDHICYITDLAKLREHYPRWTVRHALKDTIADIVERQANLMEHRTTVHGGAAPSNGSGRNGQPAQRSGGNESSQVPPAATAEHNRAANGHAAEGPLLSVVIPSYQQPESLRRVLEALACQTFAHEKFEVVVIVDGPCTAVEELLARARYPYALRWFLQPHRGETAAENAGLRKARGEILVSLDHDMVPVPEFLAVHYAAHQRDANLVVNGGALPAPDSPQKLVAELADWSSAYMARCSTPGYCMAHTDLLDGNFSIRREHLLRVGGWDEALEGYGAVDERELGFRLKNLGLTFTFEPAALAYHFYVKPVSQFLEHVRAVGRGQIYYFLKNPDRLADLNVHRFVGGNIWRRLALRMARVLPDPVFTVLRTLVAPAVVHAAPAPLARVAFRCFWGLFACRGFWDHPEMKALLPQFRTAENGAPSAVPEPRVAAGASPQPASGSSANGLEMSARSLAAGRGTHPMKSPLPDAGSSAAGTSLTA